MPQYVVAGATGRVGSVVASELLARGVQPTLIIRDEKRAAEWRARGAEIAVGSLSDGNFLATTLKGARGFFVLLPENVPPGDFHGGRRRMADAITTAAATSAVPHVVLLSAVAAVLPDGNGPAKDLHYLEARLKTIRAPVTILRSAYFQDNIGGLLGPAKGPGIYPNFLPSPDIAFPMIAIKDVGRFVADALIGGSSQTETILLLGPAYSVRDLSTRLGAALGRTLQIVPIPPDAHVPTLVQAGLPEELAEAVAEMYDAFAKGRIRPEGDRVLIGETAIDDVIAMFDRR